AAARVRPQTLTRARPFRRLAARIARPARVRMRSRKPCVFARRRLFGWNVRLLTGTPDSGRAICSGLWCSGRPHLAHSDRNKAALKPRRCHRTTTRYAPGPDMVKRAEEARFATRARGPDPDSMLGHQGPCAAPRSCPVFRTYRELRP